MKFEVVQCPQCGEAFNRTNPRKEYCRDACRVAAHRDRHGYQKPIFDKEQARLVEQITQISLEDLEELMQDAILYRTFLRLYHKEKYIDFDRNSLFQNVHEKIKTEEKERGGLYSKASYSVEFMRPINELLQYAEENPMNLFKKGSL